MKPPSRTSRRGISLVEMLIALTISAVLLLAVGMAFNASFDNYAENQEMVDAVQSSRLLMHRIMTQARKSTYLNVTSEGRRIQVETADDNYQYVYVYVPAENQVLLSRINLQTLASEDLGEVSNVTGFSIPSEQWGENPDRLTLSMTVRYGGNQSTLSGSAVPRSTIEF
jgi:prepilin-type N-terminal cleavage/methylation domain-containing protein